jgi:hypothetical protein
MIERAREIAQMMGYDGIDAMLEAIGGGEVILFKVSNEQQLEVANWLRNQIPELRAEKEDLANSLDDMADGLELAMELTHYPIDTDVCDMNLPHGWPSYCHKTAIS